MICIVSFYLLQITLIIEIDDTPNVLSIQDQQQSPAAVQNLQSQTFNPNLTITVNTQTAETRQE